MLQKLLNKSVWKSHKFPKKMNKVDGSVYLIIPTGTINSPRLKGTR